VISQRVGGLLSFGGLVALALLLAELGRSPYLQRTQGQTLPTGLDGVCIPLLQLPKALVQSQGARSLSPVAPRSSASTPRLLLRRMGGLFEERRRRGPILPDG
jgi:hypothetical protein